MPKGDKWDALVKTREAEEHSALLEEKRVRSILEGRQLALENLMAVVNKLQDRINSLSRTERYQALIKGDARQVATIKNYEKRLVTELNNLQGLLAERQLDVESAAKRADIALNKVTEARVERKKIEHLSENIRLQDQLKHAAREEISSDEQQSATKKK